MDVLYLSTDLMFGSRAISTAKGLGSACRMISASQLGEALAAKPRLVLVDLTMPVDPAKIVAQVHEISPGTAVVAFGSHVETERLASALAAGCREVLSKGEFNARMADVLGRYLSAPPAP
jgi:DNA-binding NarL/FixJ family response regulator